MRILPLSVSVVSSPSFLVSALRVKTGLEVFVMRPMRVIVGLLVFFMRALRVNGVFCLMRTLPLRVKTTCFVQTSVIGVTKVVGTSSPDGVVYRHALVHG